ncbi:hypothetical protein M8C21_032710 [Ambrosia artemisiifolia]|uniref:Hepatoma-derived growth factor-related protein 2-like n=1 Tax=Ambrosia artemisiifolia TaxID=4212 RepID=A0AAD5GW67_AMBAR|nr:hypothetical protein M8C21_032710 [Ambrosia artemisiifolia]
MSDNNSSFTDSDDERAVEDVLSQALDHSVLEQIAAINCSSFSTKDNLPFDLENRFRKLKSLPTGPTAGSRCPPSKSKSFTPRTGDGLSLNDLDQPSNDKKGQKMSALSKDDSLGSSPSSNDPKQHFEENQDEKKGSNSKSKPKSSSNSKTKSLKSKSKSSKSQSDSWSVSSSESESRSVSPVKRGIGCLWCSPKKEKRKQGKENRLSSFASSWGDEYDVDFVKTFSMKEQKKIMRQAMKEEEKINKEAEKIVKWAKQASSRMMDVSGVVDEELSDLEK